LERTVTKRLWVESYFDSDEKEKIGLQWWSFATHGFIRKLFKRRKNWEGEGKMHELGQILGRREETVLP